MKKTSISLLLCIVALASFSGASHSLASQDVNTPRSIAFTSAPLGYDQAFVGLGGFFRFIGGFVRFGGVPTSHQLSGPFTLANPFTITTPSANITTIGGTISPRAYGQYQTDGGTICNVGSSASPVAFNLLPASNNSTRQWLIGNTNCTFTVLQSASQPANAVAELFYPAIQAQRTDTIATGDGVTTTFAASYNPTGGTATNGSPVFTGLSSTDGILPGMAIFPSWSSASTGAGTTIFPFGTTVSCLGSPCGTNTATSLTMSANSNCTTCTGDVPNITGYTPGGSYPFLYMTPVPGTIIVAAGAVTGTDNGSLLNTGNVTISGAGISGSIKLVKDANYKDLIFNTHQGYYTFTFSSPPSNGVPITLTYQYGYVPTGSGTGTAVVISKTNTVSMWRLFPSVDDLVARARALAFASGSLPGSGIAVLDPAVSYGLGGHTTVLPCTNMAIDCSNTNSNGNMNAALGASTCSNWTSGNTWTWTASTKVFRPTSSGSSGSVRTFCGVNIPGTLYTTATYLDIKYNKVIYGDVTNGPLGIQIQSSNVNVEFNDVSSDQSTFRYQFVASNACTNVGGPSSQTVGNIVQNNYFHDCDGDGIDTGNSDGMIIRQNRITGFNGFSFGSHADGWQVTGLNTLATNVQVTQNYIQNFDLGMAQTYLNFVHNFTGAANSFTYAEALGASAVTSATIDSNFLDGGARGLQITSASGGSTSATFTNNLEGNNQTNAPIPTGVTPSPQTGNYNVYSGAAFNPY